MSRDQRVLTLTNNTFGTEYNIFNFCQIEYSIEIVNMGAGEKTQYVDLSSDLQHRHKS